MLILNHEFQLNILFYSFRIKISAFYIIQIFIRYNSRSPLRMWQYCISFFFMRQIWKKKIIKRESHLNIIYMCWKSRKARGVTFEMKYTNYIARRPWNFPQVFRDAETASFPAFPRKFFRSEKRVKPARKWRAYITGHN